MLITTAALALAMFTGSAYVNAEVCTCIEPMSYCSEIVYETPEYTYDEPEYIAPEYTERTYTDWDTHIDCDWCGVHTDDYGIVLSADCQDRYCVCRDCYENCIDNPEFELH